MITLLRQGIDNIGGRRKDQAPHLPASPLTLSLFVSPSALPGRYSCCAVGVCMLRHSPPPLKGLESAASGGAQASLEILSPSSPSVATRSLYEGMMQLRKDTPNLGPKP